MAKSNFENLRVYILSETLADLVWEIVSERKNFPKDAIGKQLVRATDSIGANIAEGSGRGSDPDNRRFLKIARGSLYETQHWLRRAYKRSLLTQKQVDNLLPIINELTPKLNAYLRSVGNMKKKPLPLSN